MGKPNKIKKGLYCKGRSKDRNLQAVLFVAAQQMDGHPQEKGSGTERGAKRERQPPQEHFTHAYDVNECWAKMQNLFEKGSVLPPHFLLLVEGHCRRLDKSDYALKKQERSITAILYPISTNNSISKGAKTMQTVTGNGNKTRRRAETADFKKRIGSTVYTVSVHFSRTSRETVEDKILRQIESEGKKTA